MIVDRFPPNVRATGSWPAIPRISASWRRCVETYGLASEQIPFPDVVAPGELAQRSDALSGLIDLAAPEMERLFRLLRQYGYLVTLNDSDGVTMAVQSSTSDERGMSGIGLGAVWAEERQGTNGVGTCLKDGRSISVMRSHHFGRALCDLTCFATPIFGPRGVIAATLNVTTRNAISPEAHEIASKFVRRSARTIENHYFSHAQPGEEIVRLSYYPDFADTGAEVRIALDGQGRIAAGTPSALRALSMTLSAEIELGKTELPHGLINESEDGLPQKMQIGERRLFLKRIPRGRLPAGGKARAVASEGLGPDKLRKLMDRRIPILLKGETGTGKSLYARWLHNQSAHQDRPFVAINCAAIAPELIDSELFGYRPGAFTGAARDGFKGRIAEADGGTLFLDEIGDMPMAQQARLLQVLSDGEFTPVGGLRPIRVQFALVAASLHNLVDLIGQSRFREDLYHRINGASVELPALRGHPEKSSLIERYFREESAAAGLGRHEVDVDVRRSLLDYDWPGNLRELRHIARFAATMSDDGRITAGTLPDYLASRLDSARDPATKIMATLEGCDWNVSHAARRLGVSRATLHRKIASLGLHRP